MARGRGFPVQFAATLDAHNTDAYSLLVESLQDYGIFLLDSAGTVVSWNLGGQQIHGYSRDEIVGQNFSVLYTAHDLSGDRPRQALKIALDEGRYEEEGYRVRKDGSQFWAMVTVTPLHNDHGNPIGFSVITRDISERKQTDETLQEADDLNRQLAWSVGEGIMIFDRNLRYVLFNPVMERIRGVQASEVIGKHPLDLFPLLREEGLYTLLERALAGESVMSHDVCRALPHSGKKIWIAAHHVPLRALNGEIIGVIVSVRDITQRKEAEEALRKSEEQLRLAVEGAGLGTWHWDLRTNSLLCSDRTVELLGLKTGVGPSFEEIMAAIHPEDRDRLVSAAQKMLAEDAKLDVEYRVLRPAGATRWAVARGHVYRDAAGLLLHLEGVVMDVTEGKRAQQALAESESRLRAILESEPECVKIVAEDGTLLEMNAAGLDMIEADFVAQVIGQNVCPLVKQEYREAYLDLICKACAGESASLEFEMIGLKGTHRWAESHATPFSDKDGRVVALCVTRDTSERKRAESALRDSEERFRQLAEGIREVFWLTDVQKTQMAYISPGYEAIWGRSCQSLYDSPWAWTEAIHPEDRERIRTAAQSKQVTGKYDEQYRIVRSDGTIRWVRDRAFPVRNAEGQVIRIAGVAEDITEKLQLERQLYQAQKMESIGQLAGGVAHDFNNLLTVILGTTEELLSKLPHNEPILERLRDIHLAGEKAASLTRQLLAFGRRQLLEPKVIDLNVVVADTEKLLRRLIGEDVSLTTCLDPELKHVRADKGQLEQVLMNLAVNARDAMPEGGTLTIATSNIELDEAYVARRPDAVTGRNVVLSISDNGIGMTAEVQPYIFEPFFTMKEVGQGTGLGLAVVHGIVKQSGGHVEVYSEPNLGATFKIYLPAVEEETPSAGVPNSGEMLHGTETVLLVEDELGVRQIAFLSLQMHGYTVLEAANGNQAQQIAEQHESAIDLLLSDVVMPETGGRELADALLSRYPKMKVLFMSGYTDYAAISHGLLHSEAFFLQKPFTPRSLLQRVREVLDGNSRS